MIIAADFDGTLMTGVQSDPTDPRPVGEPNLKLIKALIRAKSNGHILILWTCREGPSLDAAVEACSDLGLTFHAVNENVGPELNPYAPYWPVPRKVYANLYIDDRALTAGPALIDTFDRLII